MAGTIFNAAKTIADHPDPYKKVKDLYNQKALGLYPDLQEEIRNAEDPLLMAIKLAIIGNIIDFGPNYRMFDIENDVQEGKKQPFAVCDYSAFQKALEKTDTILYIGDNAGEIVFDKLLIEALNKPTVFVVRDAPIINDATMEDAIQTGMDKKATVISSGSDLPGTVPRLCSDEFNGIFNRSTCIISKGQGNYETLSEIDRPIFFLLKVKCPVIARHMGASVGDMVLKKQ